jgi:uncharacterized membrane protein YbaN (DUF454 family)
MLRIVYIVAGTLSLGLGITGIFIPGLPTTPFLLLAAFFYAKSSERLHKWLINHRVFGPIISDFREGKGMTVRAKLWVIFLIWLTVLITALILKPSIIFIYVHIGIGLIGTFVMAFGLPTKKKE